MRHRGRLGVVDRERDAVSRYHDEIRNHPDYKAWRAGVLDAAGYRCESCGAEDELEADHIVAISRGGEPFDPANGQCLCRTCNARKGNRPAELVRTDYVNTKWLEKL